MAKPRLDRSTSLSGRTLPAPARILAWPVAGWSDAARDGDLDWAFARPGASRCCRSNALLWIRCDGLAGDHYRGRTDLARQLTLIQAEHVAAIAIYLGLDRVEPEQLRRNIVVAGINLSALKGRRFRLGSALCVATGDCHPCSRMEDILGPGGYNAVRGHGGITARIISSGAVRPGDMIVRVDDTG